MKRIFIIMTSFLIIFFILFNVQAYEERVLTDENTFKDEISKYETAWVMYTFNGVKGKDVGERGNEFWDLLKKEFGKQVDAYLVVDTTTWSKENIQKTYDHEIGRRKAPSFVLYKNGKVVNDGTDDDIRVPGVPSSEHFKLYVDEIKKVSFLK